MNKPLPHVSRSPSVSYKSKDREIIEYITSLGNQLNIFFSENPVFDYKEYEYLLYLTYPLMDIIINRPDIKVSNRLRIIAQDFDNIDERSTGIVKMRITTGYYKKLFKTSE
jgi:hypothetical protein